MKAFYIFPGHNNMDSKLKDIPRKGIIYLKSDSEQQNTTVWVKRDWDQGFDVRVSEYGLGQFSILRSKSTLYLVEELAAMGHELSDEDEFNNAFIDAASWILYNKPDPNAKPRVRARSKRKSVTEKADAGAHPPKEHITT
jgi:hypothetical protein